MWFKKCPIKYCQYEIRLDDEDVRLKHFMYHHTMRELVDTLIENTYNFEILRDKVRIKCIK